MKGRDRRNVYMKLRMNDGFQSVNNFGVSRNDRLINDLQNSKHFNNLITILERSLIIFVLHLKNKILIVVPRCVWLLIIMRDYTKIKFSQERKVEVKKNLNTFYK